MAVIRVEKNENYTTINNLFLQNKTMSLKAKGLLSMVLALPKDWHYSINGLVAICKENETSVKTALQELKKFRYLKVDKIMPKDSESGRIEYIYTFYEIPYEEKQEGKKQALENLHLENQGQLNINNKKLNINKEIYKESLDTPTNSTEETVPNNSTALSIQKENSNTSTNLTVVKLDDILDEIKKVFLKYNYGKKFHRHSMSTKLLRMLNSTKKADRLTPNQVVFAYMGYLQDQARDEKEVQFVKGSETFLSGLVYDYAERTRLDYERAMEDKYGEGWQKVRYRVEE